jgi:hypothetical protein
MRILIFVSVLAILASLGVLIAVIIKANQKNSSAKNPPTDKPGNN